MRVCGQAGRPALALALARVLTRAQVHTHTHALILRRDRRPESRVVG